MKVSMINIQDFIRPDSTPPGIHRAVLRPLHKNTRSPHSSNMGVSSSKMQHATTTRQLATERLHSALESSDWKPPTVLWDIMHAYLGSDLVGECAKRLEGHTDFVNCVAVLPDGRVVSGSEDTMLRVWV